MDYTNVEAIIKRMMEENNPSNKGEFDTRLSDLDSLLSTNDFPAHITEAREGDDDRSAYDRMLEFRDSLKGKQKDTYNGYRNEVEKR